MISKSSGYAIRGATYLVVKSGKNRKIGIHEIAEELEVPQHFMAKILQELAKRKIIGSAKGPNGGFYALPGTSKISVISIIDAIDGLAALGRCQLGREECSHSNPCPIHFDIIEPWNKILRVLENKVIGDMVDRVVSGVAFLNTEQE